MSEVYLKGKFMPIEEACVPVMDRGFLFGDGVYELIPVYGGRPFRLSQHMERLDNSLGSVRMENPLQLDAWERIFARLTGSIPDIDQLLYLQVTRGVDRTRNHLFPQGGEPTVFVMAWTAEPRDPDISGKGIAAVVLEDNRWHRCDIKATALLGNVLLRQAAQDAGAAEAILVRDGLVTEGSSTNPFVVQDGEILTPPASNRLLRGITRDLVLELARGVDMPCAERHITRDELETADELWISSSSREVQPVTLLDGKPVGEGVPGALWRRIDDLFQDYKTRL
ncbi:aminotransferase class IV [Candidatus Thiosymbion oneisti]|uniref:aminotransferase class IV n=1 Tax=Candidatus Thiosymbion oneisti TaxID=589554 RepID=UPI000A9BFDFA|nr:aminotransferase class IV [Candidatus Thiosymbion oneisti]